MSGYLTFFMFIIYIIYNITSISVLDVKDKEWPYGIAGGSAGLGSLIILVTYYIWYKEESKINLGIFILLGLILTIGYIFNILSIFKSIKKKDENRLNTLRTKTIVSSILFIIVGGISWLVNHSYGDCGSINELLCDGNIIILLVLSNIVIYNSINYLKLHGSDILWNREEEKKDGNSENSGMDIGVLVMLCLWQFYIYFLVDGFRGVSLPDISSPKTSSDKTISGIFSGLSVIIILALLINTFVTNAQCDKWKEGRKIHVNNFREISYNIFCNSIISMIIIVISKYN